MSNYTLLNNPTVGQEVAIQSGYGNKVYFGFRIKKITPTGQLTVERITPHPSHSLKKEFRYGSDGYEIGGVSYRKDKVLFNVEACRAQVAKQERLVDAVNAILKVKVEDCRTTYGKDYLQSQIEELKTLLAAAESAVKAI